MRPVWLTLEPNVFISLHAHPNDSAHPQPAKHGAYIYIQLQLHCITQCYATQITLHYATTTNAAATTTTTTATLRYTTPQ